ncbi:GIY-YIG nuclease family protein [Pontibacter lucknowensis]|uniref:GIY-YIG nuclease family protein n=1 Tax=Pontibacter lucknowensis TaxID=1077936 RepID=UPI00117EC9D4|nr:GIY-YIG nuclease family protein [Pontibacter lucknowensis]
MQLQYREIRLAQHNAGRNTSTKAGAPWTLRYSETYPITQLARKREAEIKRKKSRKYIEPLIKLASTTQRLFMFTS